jgi:hypothetical protein
MTRESQTGSKPGPSLRAKHVYLLAAVSLFGTLVLGYLPPGTQSPDSLAGPSAAAGSLPSSNSSISGPHVLTAEEMKSIADRQAAPMIAKLQSDPNNADLLARIGAIYHVAHQYKQAAEFYSRAVLREPENVALRIKLASSLYRSGDADGAIAELDRALRYAPADANALFDLGVIRFEGKRDRKGALAAWKRLLESNPQLSGERKATVEKLMAEASITPGEPPRIGGLQTHDIPVAPVH